MLILRFARLSGKRFFRCAALCFSTYERNIRVLLLTMKIVHYIGPSRSKWFHERFEEKNCNKRVKLLELKFFLRGNNFFLEDPYPILFWLIISHTQRNVCLLSKDITHTLLSSVKFYFVDFSHYSAKQHMFICPKRLFWRFRLCTAPSTR